MDELFFVVSKLAWSFISPTTLFGWLLLLTLALLYAGYLQAAKKLLLGLCLAVVVLTTYPMGDVLLERLEARFSAPTELPSEIDGIIILGGGEQLQSSTSWQLPQMGEGGDRYLTAAVLAKEYPDKTVWVSGGSNKLSVASHQQVAEIHRQLLDMAGVPETQIRIEQNSRNTFENIKNLTQILPNKSGQYLLVTSAFHMPRTMGISQRLGLNVIPYPVDYRSQRSAQRQFDIALFAHLETLELALREWLGLAVYYLTGKTSQFLPGAHTDTDVGADMR